MSESELAPLNRTPTASGKNMNPAGSLLSSRPMHLTQFAADTDGHQRKIVNAEVRPLSRGHGDSGIPVKDGRTLPFVVDRAWNAPAGVYPEQWFLVDPESREVLYEGPFEFQKVVGLLSWTAVTDEVTESFELAGGSYLIVFALGGIMGGQAEVAAVEVAEPS